MTKARELAELSRTIIDTSDATAITINANEEVTLSDDLYLADNKMIKLGDGNDFEIYFNGNHGVVRTASSSVTGNIYIQDDNNIVLGSIGGETYLNAAKDGAVTLYYDNGVRLASSASGVEISGTLSATGVLTVIDGSTSAPSISNAGDSNTGIYFPADDQLGLLVGGSRKLHVTSSGVDIENGSLTVGNATFTGTAVAIGGVATVNRVINATNSADPWLKGVNSSGTETFFVKPDGSAAFSGAVTANAGVVVDNITIDGTEIDLSSGDLTLDVAGNILLNADGGGIYFQDASLLVGSLQNSSSDFLISAEVADKDIIFRGIDSSTTIDALKLDMSAAGFATFNDGATFSPNSGTLDIKVGTHDATNNVRLNAGGTTSTFLEYRGYLGHIWDVNTTRMMTLTSTGLGIATSSPASPLTINGNDPLITFENGESPHWQLGFENTNSDRFVLYDNNASAYRLIVDNSGNAGINTTSPNSYSNQTVLTINGTNFGRVDLEASGTLKGSVFGGGDGLNLDAGANQLVMFAGGSEAARFDSSGHFIVGNTSAFNSSSFCVSQSGLGQFRRDGTPLIIRRDGSDGSLIDFEKDGGSIGSIASDSGAMMLGSGDVGVYFDSGSDRILPMNMSTLGVRNDAISLGGNPHRFKDLYLSGGVFLGGTGSANKLDDAEEGTWTPNFNSFTGSFAAQIGRYVKVGNLVTASFHLDINVQGGTVALVVTGLPFTSISVSANYGGVTGLHCNGWATTTKPDNGLVSPNGNSLALYRSEGQLSTITPTLTDMGGGNLLAVVVYHSA